MDMLEVSGDIEAQDGTSAERPIRRGVTYALMVIKGDRESNVRWGERVVAFEVDEARHDKCVLARRERYVSKIKIQPPIFGADTDAWQGKGGISDI